MDQLVHELQDIIFSFIDRDDLKSLRLTCKSVHDSATSLYFHTVHILPFEECFQNITQNQHVRNAVRCVKCVARLLPNIDSFEEYRDRLVGTGMGLNEKNLQHFRSSFTEAQLRDYFELYSWYLESQSIIEHGKELEALTSLFAALPRLREIQLLPGVEIPEQDDDQEFLANPQDYHHIIAKECLVNPVPFFLIEDVEIGRDLPDDQYERQLRFLLAAAKKSERVIEKLTAKDISYYFFDDLPKRSQIQGYLRSLRHLSVTFESVGDANRRCLRKGRKRMSELICAPTDLESLHLSFGYLYDEDDAAPITIAEIFFDRPSAPQRYPIKEWVPPKWPNLREVSLEGIEIRMDYFVKFMETYSISLKRFELGDIELLPPPEIESEYDNGTNMLWEWETPASWVDFFKEMRVRLRLESVKFSGYLGNREDENSDDCGEWLVNDDLPCCQRGGFHTTCLKGRVENFIVNGGEWEITGDELRRGDKSWEVAYPNTGHGYYDAP